MATALFALSLVFLLGRFSAGLKEACVWRSLAPLYERRYHVWGLLADAGHMIGAIAVALACACGYIDIADMVCRAVGLIVLGKVVFEMGWRVAEYANPFAYHDHPGYWGMAGLDNTRLEAWLGRSWLSTGLGISASEGLMAGAGSGVLT